MDVCKLYLFANELSYYTTPRKTPLKTNLYICTIETLPHPEVFFTSVFLPPSPLTPAQEDLLKFIQQEMLLEHFVPRSTVPLQTAPISHDQVGVYFSCLNAESGPKRKRGQ